MIGKGFRVRVYDRHVSIATLLGTNKEYIEQEIPHISELLCASLQDLVATSDVIVVANRDPEFIRALKKARADQVIIDLVRLTEPETSLDAEYHGISW
jgi:GDP-mannose 6-dehydrogenase